MTSRPRPTAHRIATAESDRPIDFEFMAADEWLAFNCEVYDAAASIEIGLREVDGGWLHLQSGRSLPLLQLAQVCHLADPVHWRNLIDTHLATMTAHLVTESHDVVEPLSMFDLRIRLVPDDPRDHTMFGELGARPFAEGVTQILAVDVPGAVRSVPAREIDDLGWDLDEAWASAWAQTTTLEAPDELNVIDVGGADVVHVYGERTFTSSLVGVIDDIVGPVDEPGAIVSMPLGHSLLVHPIEGREASIAAHAMIPLTRQLFRNGPSSVSPHLYHWRDGRLAWIPTYFADDGIEFHPPVELASVLARFD